MNQRPSASLPLSDRRLKDTVALAEAQRVAIRSPNPRMALALTRRVDHALRAPLTRADLADAIVLRDTIVDLTGLVSSELDRLKMELIHHLGAGKSGFSRSRTLDRVVG